MAPHKDVNKCQMFTPFFLNELGEGYRFVVTDMADQDFSGALILGYRCDPFLAARLLSV